MIDFSNAKYLKLRSVPADRFEADVSPLLVEGETLLYCFQSIRDYVLFTSHRLIVVNVQGVTGKKQDFTSLPYRRIQTFSVETAGVIDLDCEIQIWFSALGKVYLEFLRGSSVKEICRLMSQAVLD